MSKAVRVLEDKIQMVSQGVERDREHNHVAIKKVQEDLNREREQVSRNIFSANKLTWLSSA